MTLEAEKGLQMATYTESPYEGIDEMSKVMLNQLNDTTSKYSSLETKLAAADGDKDAAITNWMETTDYPQALKLRQTIETATAKLRELAEKNANVEELSEEDKTKLNVELETLKTQGKAARDVIRRLIRDVSPDPENVEKALDSIPNVFAGTRGRKPGTTVGSSLPRVSAYVTVTGGNFESPQEFDSFSKVAMALNAEVKDVQIAFADAAGVKHGDIKTVDKSVSFTFQPKENGATYTLVTRPKERAKTGPKPKTAGQTNAVEQPESKTESDTEAA